MARGIDFLNEILSQYPTLGRKRKGGSDSGASRSALLKIIMPEISGGMGDSLAQLADKGDVEGFANKWADVTRRILTKVEEAGNKNDKKLKEKVDASVKRRLLPTKAKTDVNPVQLNQQLVRLKQQYRANPSDTDLMRKITVLKKRIDKLNVRVKPLKAFNKKLGIKASNLQVEANNDVNLVQLRQQLVQFKRQHHANPSDNLMKKIDALKERIDKIEKARIQTIQEKTFEYEKEKRLKSKQNG